MPRWPWPPSSSPEYPPSAERNGAPRHSRRHSRPAEAPRIAAACPADPAETGAHCAPATLPERPETARVADKVGNGARTSLRSRRTGGTWSPCPETTADPEQSPERSSLAPAPVEPVQSSPQSAPLNTSDVAIGGDVSLIRRWPTFARRSPPQVADFCTPLHNRLFLVALGLRPCAAPGEGVGDTPRFFRVGQSRMTSGAFPRV